MQASISVNNLIEKINKDKKQIINLEYMIDDLKIDIKKNEKIVHKLCKHTWVKEDYSAFDEKTCYYCSKCSLWNNDYWYK